MMLLREKKKEAQARLKMSRKLNRIERKHFRKQHRKCFWTRPFGHQYEPMPLEEGMVEPPRQCVCGKRVG